ncbi:response regulator [Salinicola avicenniae]|uniref:response regulator n=1 Tax=Salinicola avicenniae TaxID=2916836 RepID=UPI0020741467|nr:MULTISPECIES: response regulator [unclassified Salinicola]
MALRWLTTLTLLVTTLLLAFTGWQTWQWRQDGDQMLERRLQSINRVFTPSLVAATRQMTTADIDELLARLVRDPAILNATLRDADGRVKAHAGAAPSPPPRELPTATTSRREGDNRRWLQPLAAHDGETTPAYWLDLRLDPSRAAEGSERRRELLPLALFLFALATPATLWFGRRRPSGSASQPVSPDPNKTAAASQPPAEPDVPETHPAPLGEVAQVGHELRAPLSGVLGFCRLLENTPLDTQQREWLHHIHLASNGLLDTVDHILGDTRGDDSNSVFDITDLLWEVLCVQAPLAQSRGIMLLSIVYDDVPPRLIGPKVVLRQLMTNLVNNAIKYGQPGDIVVRAVLDARCENQIRLRLSVSDPGSRDPADHARLRQALCPCAPENDASAGCEDALKGREGRHGLGLDICHRLAARLGGTLSLAGREGRGNTVVANLTLQASPPFVRPAEFDLEGAGVAIWQPHVRLAYLLDHALARWHARPRALKHADGMTQLAASDRLVIVGIDRDALAPAMREIWQARFDAVDRPCLLLVDASPTHALPWQLPPGSRVLRLPMSRYMFGRTLATMLAHQRPDQPRRPRVLIIDDDEISQRYLDALLSLTGAETLVAANAAEALVEAARAPADLVLLDLHLPDAHGFELAQRLTRLEGNWPAVPLVAMTASPDTRPPQPLATYGIAELLIKPLDAQRLRDLLRHYLPTGLAPAVSPDLTPPQPEHATPAGTTPGLAAGTPPADVPTAPDTPTRLSDLAVVDEAEAWRIAGGRQALIAEMRELLFAELPSHRERLQQNWQARDLAALAETAHQLAGGCRYCGVPQLSTACEQLEQGCHAHDISRCAEALRETLAACDRLAAWIEDRRLTEAQCP